MQAQLQPSATPDRRRDWTPSCWLRTLAMIGPGAWSLDAGSSAESISNLRSFRAVPQKAESKLSPSRPSFVLLFRVSRKRNREQNREGAQLLPRPATIDEAPRSLRTFVVEPSSLEPLRRDDEFVLYRGRHSVQPGSPPVLLLVPTSTRPPLETLRKIEHEYSLRDELDPAWAVRPSARSEQSGRTTLVLEDPGGETLDRFFPGPLEMTQFLRVAVGIATALSGVHKRGLIHKDVKPANVLVNSATGEVRLTGFGIASRLPRERQTPEPPEFIAGTLPYMAPEQTGRMNRSIDSRSDLYSLGVTLYEMLTGSMPFTASDPMEWVHCHIARQPAAPSERIRNVPEALSAITMKLLSKTAEERYQTAAGVESDLRRCLSQWESQGCIDDFIPGADDTPDRLMIPEKLYGRDREVDALLKAFDRIVGDGRPELVLVSGYSGIGKSAVVNELH